MKVIVMSRMDIIKYYQYQQLRPLSLVISIYTPGGNLVTDEIKDNRDFIYNFPFFDTDDNKSISNEQAHTIVKFVNHLKNLVDQIIVQCDVGVSRSAGIAAAIAKALNNDDSYFFNSPFYCPNMTCYNRVLSAFMEE